jgi:hypothetical protein
MTVCFATREPVKRVEAARPSPQTASCEFVRALRLWLGSTRGPCIMWNRAGSTTSPIVVEEPMALEFTVCKVRWERFRQTRLLLTLYMWFDIIPIERR